MALLSNRVISKEEFLGEPAVKSSSRRGSYVEKEAKADLAFKVFDRNHDGYITKEEMLKGSKNLTKKQVKGILQGQLKSHKNLDPEKVYIYKFLHLLIFIKGSGSIRAKRC